ESRNWNDRGAFHVRADSVCKSPVKHWVRAHAVDRAGVGFIENCEGIDIGEVIGCNPGEPKFAIAERTTQSGGKKSLKERQDSEDAGEHHAGANSDHTR